MAAERARPPETSNIVQLKAQLAELEAWKDAYEKGAVKDPPDLQLIEQIRKILHRRDRPTTREVKLGRTDTPSSGTKK